MKNSLLFRLTFSYAFAFSILSVICCSLLYFRIHSVAMENMDGELEEKAAAYTQIMEKKGLDDTLAAFREEVRHEEPDEDFHRIMNLEGTPLAVTDTAHWGEMETGDVVERLKMEEGAVLLETVRVEKMDRKARLITAVIGPDTVLQIAETLEEVDEYMEVFLNFFLMLISFLVLVSTLTGWFLARRALMDMESVTRAAEDISRGAYNRRVAVRGRYREIVRLGGTFNKMADRVQLLLNSMKEINDNIAHDLRSPLARIRGIAEMTLIRDRAVEDYREMAVSTMEECDNLIELINTMMDITEAEAGVSEIMADTFELGGLIREACDIFRPLADQKEILLEADFPEHLAFHGDRRKMQRVVANILENAVKYTPNEGAVSISAREAGKTVQIDFRDTGIGISEDDLPHVFERFYRCDKSRAGDGIGLGLSLVKAYTESMGGSIRVFARVGRGSTFTLLFPIRHGEQGESLRNKKSESRKNAA